MGVACQMKRNYKLKINFMTLASCQMIKKLTLDWDYIFQEK